MENAETDQTYPRAHPVRSRVCQSGVEFTIFYARRRWLGRAQLREISTCVESDEMREDRYYLAALENELRAEGFAVSSVLTMGEPSTEIVRLARERKVDLTAMATHGHKLIGDIIHEPAPPTNADQSRHFRALLLKARKP